MQALSILQSELTRHSGWQFGGAPRYPFWQEQTACPLATLQMLLGPQGDGSQGFTGGSTRRSRLRFDRSRRLGELTGLRLFLASCKGISLKPRSTGTRRNVINDTAVSVVATQSLARISAVLCQTRQVTFAIRVDGAFRLTSTAIRISDVRRDASAARKSVHHRTLCIDPTRWRVARILGWSHNLRTTHESVSFITVFAYTERRVTHNAASGILSATSRTGIYTLFFDTSLVSIALLTDNTLWTTVRRTSDVVGLAGANRSILFHLADGVGSARRGRAWILWLLHLCDRNIAFGERISLLAWRAAAYWVVIDN